MCLKKYNAEYNSIHPVHQLSQANSFATIRRCLPHLGAEVLDLGGGVEDHLDAVAVVGHVAGQLGHLGQLGGVLLEHLSAQDGGPVSSRPTRAGRRT